MLDDKLREILEDWYPGTQYENVIPKLKQAFADEVLPLVNQMAQSAQDAFNLPIIQYVKPNKAVTEAENLMTGQEWLDRFIKELWVPPKQERIKSDDDGESHDRFYRSGGENFMYERALEAARKAGGVDK